MKKFQILTFQFNQFKHFCYDALILYFIIYHGFILYFCT